MAIAKATAGRSKDPSTKLGCVITTRDHRILATGYNGLPSGIEETLARYQRPEKYFWFEHAERNAIYSAARQGVSLWGSTAYVTACPCMDCARGLVQSGVARVVAGAELTRKMGFGPDGGWRESFNRTRELFVEAKVHFTLI